MERENPSHQLKQLEETDGVRITVSDEPMPRYPDADPHDISLTGVVEETSITGGEGNEHVEIRVDADHIPLAEPDWREEVKLNTSADDGIWRRPGVWVRTDTSPTVEVDGEEFGGGPGWKALGLLATVERI